MTLATVTVTGGAPIEVYTTLTAIDAELNARIGDGPKAWRKLMASDSTAGNDDGRSRVAVEATRFFNALSWQGTSNGTSGTTLAWPRSNVFIAGLAVDPTVDPPAIISGFFEACGLIAADPSFLTALDSGSNVKSLGAGTGRLEFFRPTSAQDGNATVLPVSLNRLIGRYLGSADPSVAAASSGSSSGTNPCSDFDRCDVDNLDWPS